MQRFLLIILFFIFSVASKAQNTADYAIDVQLNPISKTLLGKVQLLWTNNSGSATSELQFHMYLNAFKDLNSTFMKESGGQLRNDSFDKKDKDNFGNIKIKEFKVNGQTLPAEKLKYIQPDNKNINDQTVLQVLGIPTVKNGQSLKIDIAYTAKLPRIFARTGWAKNDYFFVGQWFPKIGVLEKGGKWNCHQFHADTEFYSDFGKYQVNITLPKRFVVAGTGEKLSETNLKNNLKRLSFSVENVHDFAWTASPYFKEMRTSHKGIELMAFMQPENVYLSDRYFESAKNSIDYMETHVGKYPHKILSMIDPSYDGGGSGGMEYPTLITCGANWGIGKWMKMQEVVTVHEFAHQYFQGILASNEFENSWMDEGFTQYMEGRIMDEYYGGAMIDIFGAKFRDFAFSRLNYVSMDNPGIVAMRTDAWKYPKGTYPIMSYTKPATVLKTLENLLGEKVMDKILKSYFEKFRFKHPTPQDFFDVANEVAARESKYKNLDWFFKQTILQSNVCDYAVENLKNENGKSSFRLVNLKNMEIPVEVKVVFEDGKEQTFTWGGNSKTISYEKEVQEVNIDPENKNLMDINLVNNSASNEKNYALSFKYASKMVFWLQNLFILG